MKIIYNNVIPFPGFTAINLFGIMFVREEYRYRIGERTINHESIHTAQMKEMFYIFFYIWYFLEWLIRLVVNGPSKAYRMISFEQEAYDNDKNLEYLKGRKYWSWIKYVKR